MGAPEPLQTLLVAGTAFIGGVVAVSLAASATIKVIRSTMEAKRRSLAKPCQACRGKGLYICKLCKGNNTIEWSSLFDPVHINPCQCPTCEGRSVQRCLNCLGKGYF